MLVFDRLEDRPCAGRIRDPEQAAAERGHQQSAAVRGDAPAWQREADARIEPQRSRRADLPDDRCPVRAPQVAGVVLDEAVNVGGGAVDQVKPRAVVAIETAGGPDPHAAGAILVDAERLLAVVAVGLGDARPAVAGVAEQSLNGRRPQRAATIFEKRVHLGRCAVGGGIERDAGPMDSRHASGAAKAGPDATLRGRGDRDARARASRERAAALRPHLEACAVESHGTGRRPEPEIAVHVLGDREHVARLFGGPRGQRVRDRRWIVGASAGGRHGAGHERDRQRADPPRRGTPAHKSRRSASAAYLAEAGQGVPWYRAVTGFTPLKVNFWMRFPS